MSGRIHTALILRLIEYHAYIAFYALPSLLNQVMLLMIINCLFVYILFLNNFYEISFANSFHFQALRLLNRAFVYQFIQLFFVSDQVYFLRRPISIHYNKVYLTISVCGINAQFTFTRVKGNVLKTLIQSTDNKYDLKVRI